MAAANAAVLLAAHSLVQRLGTGRPIVDTVLFLLVRILLISALVLLAGLSGTLTPAALGITGTVLLAVLLALKEHRLLRRPPLPLLGPATGVFTALVLARVLVQVWYFAPYPGDALSYHLPKVAEWVRNHSFTREMGLDTHVTFPAGFELIETWWVVFLRHDVLIEMAGVEFLLLGAVSTAAIARQLGLQPRDAHLAGLLFSLTPVLHLQATACVNDGPACAMVVAAFALVAARASWPLLLVATGLGIGIKPIFAYALPGVLLLAALLRRDSPPPRPGTRLSWSCAATALAVGVSWYLRNSLWFGNPTHPVGTRGLQGPHPIQFGPSAASLAENLLALADHRLADSASAIGPFTSEISGWGPAAFACACGAWQAVVRGLETRNQEQRLAKNLKGVWVGRPVAAVKGKARYGFQFMLKFTDAATPEERLRISSEFTSLLSGTQIRLQVAGPLNPTRLPTTMRILEYGCIRGDANRPKPPFDQFSQTVPRKYEVTWPDLYIPGLTNKTTLEFTGLFHEFGPPRPAVLLDVPRRPPPRRGRQELGRRPHRRQPGIPQPHRVRQRLGRHRGPLRPPEEAHARLLGRLPLE
jgi:hypothetical protein